MKVKLIFLLASLLALGLASCVQPVREFTPQSEFIFKGTVVLPKASTIDAQNVSDLAIVRVDEILSATKVFSYSTGKNITVKLKNPDAAQKGQALIFFTKSWYFGDSIAVVELASMKPGAKKDIDAVKLDITRVQQEVASDKLLKRISAAELIVSGKVQRVMKSDEKPMITEHDPDWHYAVIEIEGVLKGSTTGKTVRILFPNSNDVVWYDSPKFQQNMQGIWFLKPYVFKNKKLKELTIVNKGDFHPISDKVKIVRLIGNK